MNKAFTPSGLKVVFEILNWPPLLKTSMRNISKHCNISVGLVHGVINGLKETGHIIALNKKENIIDDYERLLKRWVDHYETTLKPTLSRGAWKRTDDSIGFEKGTSWGGEFGAGLIGYPLRYGTREIYSNEKNTALFKKYRIKPIHQHCKCEKCTDEHINVFDKFWNDQIGEMPKTLIYADLILKRDGRCNKIADLLLSDILSSIDFIETHKIS